MVPGLCERSGLQKSAGQTQLIFQSVSLAGQDGPPASPTLRESSEGEEALVREEQSCNMEPRHRWGGVVCGLGAGEGRRGRMTTCLLRGLLRLSRGSGKREEALSVLVFSPKPFAINKILVTTTFYVKSSMNESQKLIILNVSMSEYSRKLQGLKVYLKTSWQYNEFVLLTPQDSKGRKRILKTLFF